MTKLTVATCEKLKVRGITPSGKERTRLEYHDGGGLYLIVQKSGHKSWAFKYKRNGVSAKLTLGDYVAKGSPKGTPKIGDPLSLVEARDLVTSIKLQRNRGIDPVTERRTTATSSTSFASAAKDYVEQQCRAKKKSRAWWKVGLVLGLDYRRDPECCSPTIIKGGLVDRWHDRSVSEITEGDCFAVVDEAAVKAIPGRRAKTKGRSDSRERETINALSGMFKYLRKRLLVSSLPTSGLEREPSGERDRVLSAAELRSLWLALPDTPLGKSVKLMMLTGVRVSEAAGMRWSEIEDHTWTIPVERSKNKEKHLVPLTQAVRELIAENSSDFVFTTKGKAPVTGFGKLKRRLDAELKFREPWQYRDIRRTVATNMGELGVEPHIVEEVLGHISYKQGVAGLYNRAAYEPRKKIALEKWAKRLEAIVEGRKEEKVVALTA